MPNVSKYRPNKLLAIELLSSNPGITQSQVAKQCDVSEKTVVNWMRDPNFVDVIYTRYMEVAGIELPLVIQAIIEEAKMGNVQAGRLILEHFGKLENRVTIQMESNFEKFMKVEDAEVVDMEDDDILALDQISDQIGTKEPLPTRDSSNDSPTRREKDEKKNLEKALSSVKAKEKEKEYQKEAYKTRKRAKAVGLELLPSGRHSKGTRLKWKEDLEKLEIEKFGEVQY